MKHRQLEPWGCAMYAVANVFSNELENFVTPERIEVSKKGLIMPHLSKWMQEDGKNWGVDVWYYNHSGGKLPDEYLKYIPDIENDKVLAIPVLISVMNEGGLMHVVGGQIWHDGKIVIYDSNREEEIDIPMNELNTIYQHVFGLFCFIDLDIPSEYIVLKKIEFV